MLLCHIHLISTVIFVLCIKFQANFRCYVHVIPGNYKIQLGFYVLLMHVSFSVGLFKYSSFNRNSWLLFDV